MRDENEGIRGFAYGPEQSRGSEIANNILGV
jgi:hypothetical protein